MSVRILMDVHVRAEITNGLKDRAVEVLTAQEDGSAELPDSLLLDRASAIGRVLFSQDTDLLAEAAARQRSGNAFSGVIYAHQLRITVGRCIDDLELLAQVYDPDDMLNRVVYLPLR
jgi:hypothetical protein